MRTNKTNSHAHTQAAHTHAAVDWNGNNNIAKLYIPIERNSLQAPNTQLTFTHTSDRRCVCFSKIKFWTNERETKSKRRTHYNEDYHNKWSLDTQNEYINRNEPQKNNEIFFTSYCNNNNSNNGRNSTKKTAQSTHIKYDQRQSFSSRMIKGKQQAKDEEEEGRNSIEAQKTAQKQIEKRKYK